MHPEFVVIVTHYGLTREEYASRVGKHPSCFEDRRRPLCGNGSYHAACTPHKGRVSCPACLKLLNLKGNTECTQ
jgi:hypothetical protein